MLGPTVFLQICYPDGLYQEPAYCLPINLLISSIVVYFLFIIASKCYNFVQDIHLRGFSHMRKI